MALNTLSTTGSEKALRGVASLQPYLMLLKSPPANSEVPTSAELLAAEVSMTNYVRMRITGWNWVPGGSPMPYLENQFQLESSGSLTGTTQTVTHYALVASSSGATGEIYTVGTVSPPALLSTGKQIVIPSGYIKMSEAAPDAQIAILEAEIDDLNSTIADMNTDMDAEVLLLQDQIDDLTATLDANVTALAAANTAIGDLEDEIVALEARIDLLEA